MINPILMIIAPTSPGRFRATVNGWEVCLSSEQPFLDGARALLASGTAPDAVVVMRHAGSETDSLRARVGVAARYSVQEDGVNGPRLVRWKAPQTCLERAGIAQTVLPATQTNNATVRATVGA